jgi:hypothetical protein
VTAVDDGRTATREFDELFVVPDPDSTRYLVIVTSHAGRPHHVGTFDADDLDGRPGDTPGADDHDGGTDGSAGTGIDGLRAGPGRDADPSAAPDWTDVTTADRDRSRDQDRERSRERGGDGRW